MEALLKDRVVFVTGGAQGIGRDCALAYAKEGARVVIADLELERAHETAAELAVKGHVVHCDVGNAESVESAIETTLREYGQIDAVHNNAGIVGPAKPLHETTEEEWDSVHRVNLKSVYLTTRFAFEALRKSKGCILSTASIVGVIGQDNHAAYVSTKGGMISLTKAMAVDYAPFGIRVNAICPAAVWTPMLRKWVTGLTDPEPIEKFLDDIHLLGYCPEGDVVADTATFLISDKARFITGCVMPVTGGAELGYRGTANTREKG